MPYPQTIYVPNYLFDRYLANISEVELKVYLVIVRQTFGWIDKRTGMRKTRDRIYSSQFQIKTGFSRRMISTAIHSLVVKHLIYVTDEAGSVLCHPAQRRGKTKLYYSVAQPAQTNEQACAELSSKHVHPGKNGRIDWNILWLRTASIFFISL